MNQYLFLRRMRAPIMLLVFGVTAILDEYAGIHYSKSWPLYIIAWGLLMLAERVSLAQYPPMAPPPYAGYPPQAGGVGYGPGVSGSATGMPGTGTPAAGSGSTTTAIVRAQDGQDEERR